MQTRDSEVVGSVLAGDPDEVAVAYDGYADPLYKYCRSMLSNPADAADAVQDTFVVAAARLAELRDPQQLRAWLYAIARNECLRVLGSGKPPQPPVVPPGAADTVIDITEGAAERAELRALLTAAARGLDPVEREVLELRLRQGLEPAEVAAVLGVSHSHASSLASGARDRLETSLGALLVGRAGRGDCGGLNELLADWDGLLTPALRKRVHRHIERCATCSTRRVYELRPAVLLGLSAGAAMSAAAAESLRLSAGVPDGLKARTLALATGQDPGAVAYRSAAADRAGTFRRDGFPEPLRHPNANAGLRSSPRARVVAAAAVVVAVAVAAVAFSISGTTEHLALSGGKSPATAVTAVAHPATSSALQAPTSPTVAAAPTAAHRRSVAAPTTDRAPTTPVSSPPAPAATTPAPAASTTTPPPHATVSLSVLGAGGPVKPGGTLTIGAFTLISLTANGGPVSWSVSVSGDPGHHIAVLGPSSGTLAAGQTARVLITATKQVSGASLSVSPGGATYPLTVSPFRGF
jgi:RNA polymerase sigma factor (sigma-70 family)